MKIVSVHKYYWDRDGASRYQLEVNRLLEASGHEVVPFAMADSRNLPTPWAKYFVKSVETSRVSFSASGLRAFGRMLYGWEARDGLKHLLEDFRPDVAHLHNIYTQLSPSLFDALAERHVPAVMTIHDYHLVSPNYMLFANGRVEDMGRHGLVSATLSRFHKDSYAASFAQAMTFKLHRMLRLYERGVQTFVCPSACVREHMRLAGYPSEKLTVIPHFVETKNVTPTFGGDGSLLFVSRFVEEKGVRFVLDLAKNLPNVPCTLVGDGPLMSEVRARATGLPNVKVTGWLDRAALAACYARTSVVLVPSLWPEVFGLTVLEAYAHGKVVIASDMGALPEIVEDGVTGRLIEAEDLDRWQVAITEVLGDEQQTHRLGMAAREKAEKEFSPELHLQRLLDVFEKARATGLSR